MLINDCYYCGYSKPTKSAFLIIIASQVALESYGIMRQLPSRAIHHKHSETLRICTLPSFPTTFYLLL
jgi:hypothetical protein